MRLIYVTVTMPYGSAEAFFIPEVKQLLVQGCELLIVPRSPSGPVKNPDAEGLDECSLAKPLLSVEILWAALMEVFRHPLRCLRSFATIVRSGNAATVVKNVLVFPKGLWLGRLARRWRADHIHAQWASTNATIAMIASTISCVPWSFTAHRGDILARNLLARKARSASFVRFIAEDGMKLAASMGVSTSSARIHLLHLGVDLPASLSRREGVRETPVLLCPAYLIPRKGQRYLIEAMALLRDQGVQTRLWFAGGGPSRPSLQRLVEEKGLGGSVSFLGHLAHAELLKIYRKGDVDVVVLPTLHEGIPVALMEAMAHGIPVISTPTGGVPELLRDGAGILVPPADPVALAHGIERLLRDPCLREEMSKAGRERVWQEFAVERLTDALLACFAAASRGPQRESLRIEATERRAA